MAMLEQARVQLETVLRADAHWRGLGRATLPANRAAHERALAGNPVYRAWDLLGRVIGEMQAARVPDPGGAGPLTPPPRAPTRRPGVELRHVLERIRDDTPLESGEPGARATAAAGDGAGASPARPAIASMIAPTDIDIEEATVSFIVREPVAPAPQLAPPAASPAAQAVGPHAAGASDTATDPGEEEDTETEVRIVPRRG
jgi:hypothetical protein